MVNPLCLILGYCNDPMFSEDRSGQTVLAEQSDQGLHCLQFCLHLLEALIYDEASLFKFYSDYSKFFGCLNFSDFYGNAV